MKPRILLAPENASGRAKPNPDHREAELLPHGNVNTRPPANRIGKLGTVSGPIALLLLAVVLAGCQSAQFSSYISPRVTGRVLAADTRQPLANVKIRRVVPDQDAGMDTQPKGGQTMERSGAVWTDRAGKFALDSERDITLLGRANWYSVTLSFERAGYERFQTNYTSANVSGHSSAGEPLVNAGDILLRPASK